MHDRDDVTSHDPRLAVISMRLPDQSWVNVSLLSWSQRPSDIHGMLLSTSLMAVGALVIALLLVRSQTRPLSTFAKATERIAFVRSVESVAEEGPREVHSLATAFNDMQRRITLPALKAGEKRPLRLTVWAAKGARDAYLDRIQIIKGWIDAQGAMQEKIVDVVWSGDRRLGADGKLPPVGNTVDLKTATWTDTIGNTELSGSWVDEDFDPAQNALYYARVLQIPTPRWSTYDAVRANLPLLDGVAATIQERAWSSPVWYVPGTP